VLIRRLLAWIVAAVTLVWLGIAPATSRADFIITLPMKGGPDPNELMLYNSDAGTGVSSFTASGGQQSGGAPVLITAGTNQLMDTGAGFAAIKPAGSGLLTSVTFTPQSYMGVAGNKLYSDFGTNGQLVGDGKAPETFTLTVVALESNGKTNTFIFTETIAADSNGAYPFDFEVTSNTDGETIQSVTFAAVNGIKESKQTEFSLAPGVVLAPEPASMTLVLSGLACFGLASLRTLRRKAA